MAATDDLLIAFEKHSPAEIQRAIADGADPNEPIEEKTPIVSLYEMYTRSANFTACLQTLLDAGAVLDDALLKAVLLDDGVALSKLLTVNPSERDRRFHLECAYTSLHDVSPLHVCAEYNSVDCARVLLDAGADIDSRAGVDAEGFGGHTALFHCVNSNLNYCRKAMELLVDRGASLDIHLKGLRWGVGFEWETTVFETNPISYAQCGLYFQFHRREAPIYSNINYMYRARYGTEPRLRNVPNRYLRGDVFPPRC